MRAVLLGLLTYVLSAPAIAQELDGTLLKVKTAGVIVLGHREASIPFSYLNDQQQPIGYSMDICPKVVDAVREELRLPKLAVRFVPVTSSNRIPLLQNGTIDLECGSTTNSVVRQQQAAFSLTTFVVNVTAAVRSDSGINSFADLDGKTISTTSGTTSIPLLQAYTRTGKIDLKELYGKDHAESFMMMTTGRSSAFVMDDVLLAGQIASSRDPGGYKILRESLRQEPYGLMLRRDDPRFKALVDRAVERLIRSGEIDKLYTKWFNSPIPPRGVNLNFPMTPALREAFKNPNDRGV